MAVFFALQPRPDPDHRRRSRPQHRQIYRPRYGYLQITHPRTATWIYHVPGADAVTLRPSPSLGHNLLAKKPTWSCSWRHDGDACRRPGLGFTNPPVDGRPHRKPVCGEDLSFAGRNEPPADRCKCQRHPLTPTATARPISARNMIASPVMLPGNTVIPAMMMITVTAATDFSDDA